MRFEELPPVRMVAPSDVAGRRGLFPYANTGTLTANRRTVDGVR